MTILGKFVKQPYEVDVYAIQFAKDMNPTDEIAAAWHILARTTAVPWNGVYKTTSYTATLDDDNFIIVTDHDVTLPTGAPDGYVLYVASNNISSAISVGGFSVAVRGAIVVTRIGGSWVVEASSSSVVVSGTNDQRVRTFMSGGYAFTSYKIQVCVILAEGRRLQDEFVVKIRDT